MGSINFAAPFQGIPPGWQAALANIDAAQGAGPAQPQRQGALSPQAIQTARGILAGFPLPPATRFVPDPNYLWVRQKYDGNVVSILPGDFDDKKYDQL